MKRVSFGFLVGGYRTVVPQGFQGDGAVVGVGCVEYRVRGEWQRNESDKCEGNEDLEE